MPALPDQPLVHRSWLTRGLYWPSPTWGLDAPAFMLDTTVSFVRMARRQTGGTWENDGDVAYLVTQAHVEIEEGTGLVSDDVQNPGIGFVKRRNYLVIIPVPEDTALIPKPHERIWFTDAKGDFVDMPIASVTMPENLAGHLEIATEAWE